MYLKFNKQKLLKWTKRKISKEKKAQKTQPNSSESKLSEIFYIVTMLYAPAKRMYVYLQYTLTFFLQRRRT